MQCPYSTPIFRTPTQLKAVLFNFFIFPDWRSWEEDEWRPQAPTQLQYFAPLPLPHSTETPPPSDNPIVPSSVISVCVLPPMRVCFILLSSHFRVKLFSFLMHFSVLWPLYVFWTANKLFSHWELYYLIFHCTLTTLLFFSVKEGFWARFQCSFHAQCPNRRQHLTPLPISGCIIILLFPSYLDNFGALELKKGAWAFIQQP